MKTAFEKSRFPLRTILIIVIVILTIRYQPWNEIAARFCPPKALKTYHWKTQRVCTSGEEDFYIEDQSHREVAHVFNCGEGDTWSVFSIETSPTTRESYERRDEAIKRVESLFK